MKFIHEKRLGTEDDSLSADIVKVLRANHSKRILFDASRCYTGGNLLQAMEKGSPLFEKLACKGSRIGILLPSSATSAATFLVAMALGYVPVMLDILATPKNLRRLLKSINVDCLVVPEDFELPDFPHPYHIIRVNGSGVVYMEESKSVLQDRFTTPRDGTAAILYTSGSSGEPKGIQVATYSIRYTVKHLIKEFELDENTVASCVLPICHTMGFNTQFLPTFFAGGACEFSPASQGLASMYRRILMEESNFLSLISELVRFCYEEKKRKKLSPASHVKHVQLAGGFIREEHLTMARDLFPNATIHKGYGLTEAIRVSMVNSTDPNFHQDTAGYPLPGHTVEVRDEKGNLLPEKALGRLFIKGPNVMLGYDNIVSPSPIDDRGFLDTGDMGYVFDGKLAIHGRHDSVFKVKGKRVSGKEIESIVRSFTDSFLDVKCLPVHCARRGSKPILFLEVDNDKITDFLAKEKMAFEAKLREELEDNGRVPKDIYLVDYFPRTSNGKVKYKDLNSILENNGRHDKSISMLGKDKLGFYFYMVSAAGTSSEAIEEAFCSTGGEMIH